MPWTPSFSLSARQEFSLAVFGNVQLADAFDGGIAVVQADDMKVLVLHGDKGRSAHSMLPCALGVRWPPSGPRGA